MTRSMTITLSRSTQAIHSTNPCDSQILGTILRGPTNTWNHPAQEKIIRFPSDSKNRQARATCIRSDLVHPNPYTTFTNGTFLRCLKQPKLIEGLTKCQNYPTPERFFASQSEIQIRWILSLLRRTGFWRDMSFCLTTAACCKSRWLDRNCRIRWSAVNGRRLVVTLRQSVTPARGWQTSPRPSPTHLELHPPFLWSAQISFRVIWSHLVLYYLVSSDLIFSYAE